VKKIGSLESGVSEKIGLLESGVSEKIGLLESGVFRLKERQDESNVTCRMALGDKLLNPLTKKR